MGGAATAATAAAKELAPSLWGAIKAKLAPVVGGGVAVPSAFDWIYNSGKADDDPTKQKDFIPVWSTIREAATNEHGRQQEILLNSLIGGASGGAFGATGAIGSIPGIVAKDTMLSGKRFMDRVQEDTLPTLVNEVAKSNTLQAETAAKANQLAADAAASDKMFKYIGTGLGALGLGLSGAALYKYLTKKDKKDKTSIKYRIQGKKGDPWSEAILDMPIKTPKLPQATREMMDAGLRRRLSKNVKYLSQKRDPNTGEMISYEDWEDMGGDDLSMSKGASALDSGLLIAKDTLVPGALGYGLGKLFGMGDRNSAIAGALAALAPNALGAMVGKLKGKRTDDEQIDHLLNDSTILRSLIPGYGAYEAMRRPDSRPYVTPEQNTPPEFPSDSDMLPAPPTEDEEEEDEEDYDDFDKEASSWASVAVDAFRALSYRQAMADVEKSAAAGPPPPQTPPGQKGMAPARAMSGTPVAPGQSYKALPDVKGSSQAKGALQALMSQFGVQPPPSQQQGGQQPPPPQTPMGPPPPPAQ